jgi:hypothetical protein
MQTDEMSCTAASNSHYCDSLSPLGLGPREGRDFVTEVFGLGGPYTPQPIGSRVTEETAQQRRAGHAVRIPVSISMWCPRSWLSMWGRARMSPPHRPSGITQ